jgi:tetratricopeptide (TPR) repeat protein
VAIDDPRSRIVRGLLLRALPVCLGLLAVLPLPTLEASQAAASAATIQERLNRVGSELFSGARPAAAAVPELKAILALDPRLAEAHLLLAVAYRMQGSPELTGETKAELVQAIDLKPDLVPARVYLAQLYLDLGRPAAARDALNAGLLQQPAEPQLTAVLAETERQLGHPEKSIELARTVLQADASFAQARYYLGLALLDVHQRDAAITELERVVAAGTKVADPNLALGIAYIDAGRIDEAVATLAAGTAIDPGRADLRIALARAYRTRGSLTKADEQLNLAKPKAVAGTPSRFIQQQVEPDFYRELGLLRMRQRRLDAAAQAFQKVLDIQPEDAEAARALAEVRKLRQNAVRKAQTPGGLQ